MGATPYRKHNYRLAVENRCGPPLLREQAEAEEALGEAVDVLARAFGPAADGDHQHLDAGLMHAIAVRVRRIR